MAGHTAWKKLKKQKTEEKAEVETAQPAVDEEAERLKAETDALLQEIDDLLDDVIGESTAQEFVEAYKQKGGE